MGSKHPPRGWVLTHFANLAIETGGAEVPKSCTIFFNRPGTGDENPGITEYCSIAEANALAEEREARARREAEIAALKGIRDALKSAISPSQYQGQTLSDYYFLYCDLVRNEEAQAAPEKEER